MSSFNTLCTREGRYKGSLLLRIPSYRETFQKWLCMQERTARFDKDNTLLFNIVLHILSFYSIWTLTIRKFSLDFSLPKSQVPKILAPFLSGVFKPLPEKLYQYTKFFLSSTFCRRRLLRKCLSSLMLPTLQEYFQALLVYNRMIVPSWWYIFRLF